MPPRGRARRGPGPGSGSRAGLGSTRQCSAPPHRCTPAPHMGRGRRIPSHRSLPEPDGPCIADPGHVVAPLLDPGSCCCGSLKSAGERDRLDGVAADPVTFPVVVLISLGRRHQLRGAAMFASRSADSHTEDRWRAAPCSRRLSFSRPPPASRRPPTSTSWPAPVSLRSRARSRSRAPGRRRGDS